MKSGVHYPAVNSFPSKGMPILDEVWNNTFTKGSYSMQDGLGIKFPFVDDEFTIVPTVDPEDIYIPMQKTRDGTDTILFRDIPAQNWGVHPTEMDREKDKVLKQLLSQQSPDDELKPRFAGDTLASMPEMLWELPGQVRDAFYAIPRVMKT